LIIHFIKFLYLNLLLQLARANIKRYCKTQQLYLWIKKGLIAQ